MRDPTDTPSIPGDQDSIELVNLGTSSYSSPLEDDVPLGLYGYEDVFIAPPPSTTHLDSVFLGLDEDTHRDLPAQAPQSTLPTFTNPTEVPDDFYEIVPSPSHGPKLDPEQLEATVQILPHHTIITIPPSYQNPPEIPEGFFDIEPEHYTTRQIIWLSIKQAAPMIASTLIVNGGNAVGIFFLARNGYLPETALITAFEWTLPVASGILQAVAIRAAKYYGRGIKAEEDGQLDRRAYYFNKIGIIFQQGIFVGGLMNIPLGSAFLFSDRILHRFKQPDELIPNVTTFCRWYLIGIPGYLLGYNNTQTAISIQKQHIVLLIQTASVGSGILLGWFLLEGTVLLGFSSVGIKSFAIGTSLQYWLSAISMMLYLRLSKTTRDYNFFALHGLIWKQIKHILKSGTPIMLFIGTEVLSLFGLTNVVGWLGKKALSALEATDMYTLLKASIDFAHSEATCILVSQMRGENRFHDMRRFGNINLLLGLGFGSVCLIVFEAFPEQLLRPFMDIYDPANADLVASSVTVLRNLSPGLVINAIRIISGGALRGLDDVALTAAMAVICFWAAGIPLSYGMGIRWGLGLFGISWGYNIGLSLGAITQPIWWFNKASEVSGTPTRLTRAVDTVKDGVKASLNKLAFWNTCRRDQQEEEQPALPAPDEAADDETQGLLANAQPELTIQDLGDDDPIFAGENPKYGCGGRCTIL